MTANIIPNFYPIDRQSVDLADISSRAMGLGNRTSIERPIILTSATPDRYIQHNPHVTERTISQHLCLKSKGKANVYWAAFTLQRVFVNKYYKEGQDAC